MSSETNTVEHPIRPGSGSPCFAVRLGDIRLRADVWFNLPHHRDTEARIRSSPFSVHSLSDESIVEKLVDGPFGTQIRVEDYRDSGVPLIRVSDCRDGDVNENNLVFIDEDRHAQLLRSEVVPGDVLLTKTGNILGYSAIFPTTFQKGNISSHIVMIRTHAKRLLPEYLSTFFSTPIGQRQIYRWGQKATRPELNTIEIRQFMVPVPPPSAQSRLMKTITTAKTNKRDSLSKAAELLREVDHLILKESGVAHKPFIPKATSAFAIQRKRTAIDARLNADYFHPERIAAIKAVQDA